MDSANATANLSEIEGVKKIFLRVIIEGDAPETTGELRITHPLFEKANEIMANNNWKGFSYKRKYLCTDCIFCIDDYPVEYYVNGRCYRNSFSPSPQRSACELKEIVMILNGTNAPVFEEKVIFFKTLEEMSENLDVEMGKFEELATGYMNENGRHGEKIQEYFSSPTVATTVSAPYDMTDLLLCLFLGGFGAHRFYRREFGMGLLYLCTFGLFYIGTILDLVKIIKNLNK